MLKRKNKVEIHSVVRHVFLAWLAAVMTEYLILPSEHRDLSKLDGLAQMSLLRVIVITCVTAALLTAISCYIMIDKFERIAVIAVFGVIITASLKASATLPFFAVCVLMLAVLAVFGAYGWNSEAEDTDEPTKAHRVYVIITVILSVALFLFLCVWTVCRVYSFSCPTYDFGIFSQMFYNMNKCGLPLTTVERDGLLSHFAVHVSPIYYLMLPFYKLSPTPATLQVLQALVVVSAVIPLWKICEHHGLTGGQRMLACAMLMFSPAYSGGVSYDIHENCFLTPLILWLFYGIDKRNIAVTAVAAMLTLTVKEDAAVYVAVIALWLTVKTVLNFDKSDIGALITGIVLLLASVAWFLLVTGYLAKSGDGVMTYRYTNFMYGEASSLFTVIKSVILNPMKAVYECVDSEKLGFIAVTILPLMGLPLITRRYERYILLIPYILVNLMSDYAYQHDIFFQYTFGSIAFLIYLTVVNLADMKLERQRTAFLIACVAVSAVCFSVIIIPKAVDYPIKAVRYYDSYLETREALDTIPDDASVSATTFYTAYLSQRETLYDIRYSSTEHILETEYIVLRVDADADYSQYETAGQGDGYGNLVEILKSNGYAVHSCVGDDLVIFGKPTQVGHGADS